MLVMIGDTLMDLEGVIFDMDGTILDSMPTWRRTARKFCERYGDKPDPRVEHMFITGTIKEAATMLVSRYHLQKKVEQVENEINQSIEQAYFNEIPLKESIGKLMKFLHVHNIKIAIATASDRYLVEAMCRRTGIETYIDEIVTCTEVGYGKRSPEVYNVALMQLRLNRDNVLIAEDALYAIETAKKNHYMVLGVGDDSMKKDRPKIKKKVDFYIPSLKQWLDMLKDMEGEKSMKAEEMYSNMTKQEVFEESNKYWNYGKTKEWLDMGIDLVIGRREGYYFWDMEGKKLMDVHINGGTYSLGHRNKEVIQALIDGMNMCDMGNHHFTSPPKVELSKKLIEVSPDNMKHVVFGSSGGEAVDLALKCARYATKRRKIVSIKNAYHGHTGLAVAAGAERYSELFCVNRGEDEFVKVPFNDIDAMENALKSGDVACVIMETIPATYGFPMPMDGYLPAVKKLCERYGTLYIADEVQTGLMRSGEMWCISTYGVTPDIIVTSKGLSGGIYPISAVILNEAASGWMGEDGSGHMSTYGGSELGCFCALKVFEILQRKETKENVEFVSRYLRAGLDKIQKENSEIFKGIRQNGTIMGLEFAGEKGAIPVMRHLYENGVWAIYSQLDNSVVQFKPGILCTKEYMDELLTKMGKGIAEAKREALNKRE